MTVRVALRPARPDDLLPCAQIWSDSIEDYVGRLNQPWFAGDLEPLRRLLEHFLATDPRLFVVAAPSAEPERLVGFGSATLRGRTWFLGMLFVLPEFQRAGLGRRLLEAILPSEAEVRGRGLALGTATDSVQPISNALYVRFGMVPRVPILNLVGRPTRLDGFPPVPDGITVAETRWAEPAVTGDESDESRAIDAIDQATVGFEHPEDHAFLRSEGRRRFVARAGAGDVVGYGYIAPSGRFGPIAARDAALLAPIAGHLLRSVSPPGAYATWVPGTAGDLFRSLMRAGLRIEGFPALLLWDHGIGDFSRYVPINLALL